MATLLEFVVRLGRNFQPQVFGADRQQVRVAETLRLRTTSGRCLSNTPLLFLTRVSWLPENNEKSLLSVSLALNLIDVHQSDAILRAKEKSVAVDHTRSQIPTQYDQFRLL